MPWVRTTAATVSGTTPIQFTLGSPVTVTTVGISIEGIPNTTYERLGYLWLSNGATIGGVAYAIRLSVGAIWFPTHRYDVGAQTGANAFLFKASRSFPFPKQVRILYFTP